MTVKRWSQGNNMPSKSPTTDHTPTDQKLKQLDAVSLVAAAHVTPV